MSVFPYSGGFNSTYQRPLKYWPWQLGLTDSNIFFPSIDAHLPPTEVLEFLYAAEWRFEWQIVEIVGNAPQSIDVTLKPGELYVIDNGGTPETQGTPSTTIQGNFELPNYSLLGNYICGVDASWTEVVDFELVSYDVSMRVPFPAPTFNESSEPGWSCAPKAEMTIEYGGGSGDSQDYVDFLGQESQSNGYPEVWPLSRITIASYF